MLKILLQLIKTNFHFISYIWFSFSPSHFILNFNLKYINTKHIDTCLFEDIHLLLNPFDLEKSKEI